MDTLIKVLRGADTIGGSCIKIIHGRDVVVLDYGMPLMGPGGSALEKASVLKPSYQNNILINPVNEQEILHGYVVSHAHPDHYGLINYVTPDVPIYMSDSSITLLKACNIFYPVDLQLSDVERCHSFSPGKPFQLGPFTITAYLMDHSAFGACALHVSVGGKSIFYTGDFRGHGRKTAALDYLFKRVHDVDVLLMEGTTLDNGHPNTFKTEQCVEQAFVEQMDNDDHLFVAASGSNIDRLVSLYNACKRSGRILVLDLYQVSLLEALKQYAPGLPPHANDCIRVYYPKSQAKAFIKAYGEKALFKYSHLHINADKLENDKRYVFRLSNFYLKHLIGAVQEKNQTSRLVYSMWQGYMKRQTVFHDIETLAGHE